MTASCFAADPVNTAPAVHSYAAKPAGYGSHGMALFGGRDGLYASHLPMIHAPHDAHRCCCASTSRMPLWTTVKPFTLHTTDLKAPTLRALKAAVKAQVGGALQVGKTLYFATEDLK